MSNFSGGDITNLVLKTRKEKPEKDRKAKTKIVDRGRKIKEKKNRDC